MATVIIEESSPQAKIFLEFTRTLPFAKVMERKAEKKSFAQAAEECNAVSVDVFFDELNARIEKWPDNA